MDLIQKKRSDKTLPQDPRKIEEALGRSEEKYHALFKKMMNGFALHEVVLNKKGKPIDFVFLEVNSAFEQLTGLKEEDVIGKKVTEVLPEIENETKDLIDLYGEVALTGQEMRTEGYLKPLRKWFSVLAFSPQKGQFVTIFDDITERKEAEEELHHNEQVLRLFVEHSPAAIAMFDREMRYIVASKRYLIDYQLGEQELTGRSHYEVFPEIPERWKEIHRRCLNGAIERTEEDPFPRKDGRLDWVRWTIHPWYESTGEIGGLILFSEVITKRKQAEEALRESQRRLATLMSNLPGLAYRCKNEPDWTMEFVSNGCQALTGYTPERLLDNVQISYAKIIHPDDRQMVWNNIQKTLKEKKSFQLTYRIITAEGHKKWVWEQGQGVFGSKNEVIALEGFITDITDLKQAEESLRKSQQELKAIFDNSLNAIIVADDAGNYLSANQAAADMFGYSADQLTTMNVGDLRTTTSPDAVQRYEEYIQKGYEIGEFDFIRSDGQRRIAQYHAVRIRENFNLSVLSDITSRKEAETALRESEEKYRLLADNTLDVIWALNMDLECTYVNPAIKRLTGHSPSEFLGTHLSEHCDGAIFNRLKEVIQQEVAKGHARQGIVLETELLRKNRSTVPVEAHGLVIFDAKKNPVGLQAIIHDITERKQAEKALRKSEEKYRNFVENINDVLFTTDKNGVITYISSPIKSIIGYNPQEMIGRPFHEFLYKEDLPEITRQFQKIMSSHIEARDYRIVAKSGEICWLHSSSRPMLIGNRPVGLQGMLTDITQRKRAEMIRTAQYNITRAAVTAADTNVLFTEVRNELANLVDTANFTFVMYDEKNSVLSTPFFRDQKDPIPASWSVERSLTGKVILQKKSLLLTKKRIKNLVKKNEIKIIGTIPEIWLGIPLFAEQKVIGALVIQNYENPKAYDKGTVETLEVISHILGTFINRKRAEAERERLNAAIEQAAESVVITDVHGKIEYVNPAFERLTGYPRSEAIGQNPRILKSGQQDAHFYQNLWETISNRNIWKGKFINRRKDGSLFTEEATISPIFDPSGNIVQYVAVKHDITKELELEQQYQQAQKMESIGRLAGGVAHDFNNLLSVILGYSEMILANLDSSDSLYPTMQEIHKAGLRSADLTTQLLAFARKQTIAPQVLNLNDGVANMLKMLRRLIGEDIELTWKPGASLWPVKIDPAQIDQLLANLSVNARDAIDGNGNLTIETKNVSFDETYSQKHAYAKPGSYVLLAISDDGCGMDKKTLSQIFEPFFTTKALGEGTGLGLATVYGIVKQNKGFVNVYSEPGNGTTFKIYIPRYIGAKLVEQAEETVKIPRGQGELILLVEDEGAILELAQIMLENIGYKVLVANTPLEALKLAQKQTESIKILLTDVIMPEMNGKELSKKIKELFPELRTVFMSGYTSDTITHHGVLEEGVHFISKPFSMSTLAVKVHEVLNREQFVT